jgi:hypothetical protein
MGLLEQFDVDLLAQQAVPAADFDEETLFCMGSFRH